MRFVFFCVFRYFAYRFNYCYTSWISNQLKTEIGEAICYRDSTILSECVTNTDEAIQKFRILFFFSILLLLHRCLGYCRYRNEPNPILCTHTTVTHTNIFACLRRSFACICTFIRWANKMRFHVNSTSIGSSGVLMLWYI